MTERAGRAKGFGPTMLGGIVTAALLAVASAKGWYAVAGENAAVPGVRDSDRSVDMPLALALALVLLASWGAYLVSRERGRRIVATLALLADLGLLAAVAWAPGSLPDQLRERVGGDVEVGVTGWFVTAAIVGVLALVPVVAAWRQAPAWPTMSSRYDAPASGHGTGPSAQQGPLSDTDLWKSLDEGHDPTLGPTDGR